MEVSKKKVLRTQYLIDKKFQLKYTLGLIIVVIAMSVFFAFAAHSYIQDVLTASVQTQLTESQAAASLAREQVKSLSNNIFLLFGFFMLIMTMFSILVTHRMAGPMFALKRRMNEVAQGIIHAKPLQFRRTDEFQDVAEIFNSMMKNIHRMRKEELQEIHDVLAETLNTLERANIPLEQLDTIRNSLKKLEKEQLREAA